VADDSPKRIGFIGDCSGLLDHRAKKIDPIAMAAPVMAKPIRSSPGKGARRR